MTKSFAAAQARRVNLLVVEWKKAGDVTKMNHCKQFRNMWMEEARRA